MLCRRVSIIKSSPVHNTNQTIDTIQTMNDATNLKIQIVLFLVTLTWSSHSILSKIGAEVKSPRLELILGFVLITYFALKRQRPVDHRASVTSLHCVNGASTATCKCPALLYSSSFRGLLTSALAREGDNTQLSLFGQGS